MQSNKHTEPLRSAYFNAEQQADWNTRSTAAINTILSMLRKNDSLYEIYAFGSKERASIANDHKTKDAAAFGVLREKFGRDLYEPGFISGGATDPSIYNEIIDVVIGQSDQFSKTSKKTTFVFGNRIYNPEKGVLDVYVYDHQPDPDGLGVSFCREHKIEEDVYLPPSNIYVQWPKMNRAIYIKKTRELNALLKDITSPKCQGDEALFKIGLLTYELCRMVPLERGSSAVTGWIMKALCMMKNFDVGNLRIHNLPFDIYAQLVSNREQYACDFARAIKPDFKENALYNLIYLKNKVIIEGPPTPDFKTSAKTKDIYIKAFGDKDISTLSPDEMYQKVQFIFNWYANDSKKVLGFFKRRHYTDLAREVAARISKIEHKDPILMTREIIEAIIDCHKKWNKPVVSEGAYGIICNGLRNLLIQWAELNKISVVNKVSPP